MVVHGSEITIINSAWETAAICQFDTIIYDPPYDGEWYGRIPKKQGSNNTLIVFANPITIAEAILGGVAAGYSFAYLVTWDCVSSWYTPGRILMRSNLVAVFSDNEYCAARAIVMDGKRRKGRGTKNSRGSYHRREKSYTALSTVFVKMRSMMDKAHPHEKPIELVQGILQSVNAGPRVLDCFGGSGACAIAAQLAGCRSIELYETDIDRCAMARFVVESYFCEGRSTGELFDE